MKGITLKKQKLIVGVPELVDFEEKLNFIVDIFVGHAYIPAKRALVATERAAIKATNKSAEEIEVRHLSVCFNL